MCLYTDNIPLLRQNGYIYIYSMDIEHGLWGFF